MISESDIGKRVKCTKAHERTLAKADRGDEGRLSRIIGGFAVVYWDSGVETPIDVDRIERA